MFEQIGPNKEFRHAMHIVLQMNFFYHYMNKPLLFTKYVIPFLKNRSSGASFHLKHMDSLSNY